MTVNSLIHLVAMQVMGYVSATGIGLFQLNDLFPISFRTFIDNLRDASYLNCNPQYLLPLASVQPSGRPPIPFGQATQELPAQFVANLVEHSEAYSRVSLQGEQRQPVKSEPAEQRFTWNVPWSWL